MPIALATPQLIEIHGPDALAFAQAQFSSDVHALANGHWQWSAWLSAQGRVRSFFHLLRDGDESLRLLLRGGSALPLRDALARYVLRAKVQLRVIEGVHAYAIEETGAVADGVELPQSYRIQRAAQSTRIALPGARPRWLVLNDPDAPVFAADNLDTARNGHELADIEAGIVTLHTELQDKLLPDWIGLSELGATSVGKGCYPGQEVIARLHFKGGNKRWLHRLRFSAEALPIAGTQLGGNDSDTSAPALIVCSAWATIGEGNALAVLREGTNDEPALLSSTRISILNAERVSPLRL